MPAPSASTDERNRLEFLKEPNMRRLSKLVAALAAVFSAGMLAAPRPASADIFQWEYINPADPSQGKQPSTTLCPGGAGLDAAPGANLGSLDLTKAYLILTDLTGASFQSANLTIADLSRAKLINANLTNANLTNATLGGADFSLANLTNANLA